MITVTAPIKKTLFQVIDFPSQLGGTIPYNYPTAPPSPLSTVDEVIVSNSIEGDTNQLDFIKRFDTWFVFTSIDTYPNIPYNIILIKYDRVNRIAYTYTDTLVIKRKV
jgi:hypothetical protein